MTLTIDASVAVKWFFEEVGSDEARSLIGTEALIAPDFILLEVHHVLMKRLRREEIPRAGVERAMPLLRGRFSRLEPSERLLETSVEISLRYDHAIYDCLYVALARRERATLVTADVKQADVARRAGAAVRLA